MMREPECDCQCGTKTQKISEGVGEKSARLSPMTSKCLFHHLIFDIMSIRMCVCSFVRACEVVLYS